MNNFLFYVLLAFMSYLVFRYFQTNNSGKLELQILKIQQKSVFLVDVRQPDEFSAGTVKGVVNIPLGEVQNRINEFKNKENIVVFCRTGIRSGKAMSILQKNGIKNVVNGGGWQNVASVYP